MPTKRYSTEQIVSKLRQAEEELSRGLRTPAMCKKRGISEQTYYRWRTKRSTIRFSKRWRLGKLLSPPRRRQAVALVRHRLGVSERRACRVLGQARSTHRHRARRPDDEPPATVGGPDHRVGDARTLSQSSVQENPRAQE